jgi:hypothetical protein
MNQIYELHERCLFLFNVRQRRHYKWMDLPDKACLYAFAADFMQLTLKTGYSQIKDCMLYN